MKKKKEKEFRFFWEEPIENIKKDFNDPFELRFTFPGIKFPEASFEKTIPISMGETDKKVVIRAELPGFKKDEISLNVTENFIEIAAAKKEEKIERTEKSYMHERSSGAIRRAFSLPKNVDPENADAKLEDGLLTVTLPKLHPEEKKKKKVPIK
ncbi:MAG: Hsp20/alpha crystallin family protein [Candidatus Aenigmatarchaeota archaeon]